MALPLDESPQTIRCPTYRDAVCNPPVGTVGTVFRYSQSAWISSSVRFFVMRIGMTGLAGMPLGRTPVRRKLANAASLQSFTEPAAVRLAAGGQSGAPPGLGPPASDVPCHRR